MHLEVSKNYRFIIAKSSAHKLNVTGNKMHENQRFNIFPNKWKSDYFQNSNLNITNYYLLWTALKVY